MHIDVDQSGRIEFTKDDSVLAFSNGESSSVLISAVVKRTCIHVLRRRGLSGPRLYIRLFATVLYLLLRDYAPAITQVQIDVEYLGKDAAVKEHLVNLLRRANSPISSDRIQFGHIGKHSN